MYFYHLTPINILTGKSYMCILASINIKSLPQILCVMSFTQMLCITFELVSQRTQLEAWRKWAFSRINLINVAVYWDEIKGWILTKASQAWGCGLLRTPHSPQQTCVVSGTGVLPAQGEGWPHVFLKKELIKLSYFQPCHLELQPLASRVTWIQDLDIR